MRLTRTKILQHQRGQQQQEQKGSNSSLIEVAEEWCVHNSWDIERITDKLDMGMIGTYVKVALTRVMFAGLETATLTLYCTSSFHFPPPPERSPRPVGFVSDPRGSGGSTRAVSGRCLRAPKTKVR